MDPGVLINPTGSKASPNCCCATSTCRIIWYFSLAPFIIALGVMFFNGILSVKPGCRTDATLSSSFVTPVVPRRHISCLDKNALVKMLRMEVVCSLTHALNPVYTLKQLHWLWVHCYIVSNQSCSLPSNPSSLSPPDHTEPPYTLSPLSGSCASLLSAVPLTSHPIFKLASPSLSHY